MKTITVYLDDYDRPLIGRAVLNDDYVEEAVKMLKEATGEDYIIEVTTPDTIEEIIAELRRLKED